MSLLIIENTVKHLFVSCILSLISLLGDQQSLNLDLY